MVAQQADGKLVVAGESGSDWITLRYDAGGSLDPGFGSGGLARQTFAGAAFGTHVEDLAIQPDGKILLDGVVCSVSCDWALARYNPDGTLDAGFGSGGVVETSVGGAHTNAVRLQTDGKIVVAGEGDAPLGRYNADGTLDSSFGSGGIASTPALAGTFLTGVVIQPDGKIVGLGWRRTDRDRIVLVRYTPSGVLDPTFGSGGIIEQDPTGQGAVMSQHRVAVQPDGKMLITGCSSSSCGRTGMLVLRYLPDGTLDSSFGTGGVVVSSALEIGTAIGLEPDGRIVTAGCTNGSNCGAIGVARLLGDAPVVYAFNGFASPVDNPPVLNV